MRVSVGISTDALNDDELNFPGKLLKGTPREINSRQAHAPDEPQAL